MMMLSCLGLGSNGVGVSSARTNSIDNNISNMNNQNIYRFKLKNACISNMNIQSLYFLPITNKDQI